MTVVINGTSGITDVNGTAAAPAITGTDTDTGVFFGTNTVSLSTNGTERLQIDSSGNLGLGVTPSAWATLKGLDISTYAALYGFTNQAGLAFNSYYDGTGWKYKQSSTGAGRYGFDTGTHYWLIAGSGTAGNAITFTQAMTLDASGNLGIGTTSPNQLLDVRGSSSPTIKIRNTGAVTNNITQLLFEGTNTFSGTSTSFIQSISLNSGNSSTALVFGTNADGGGAAAERARIDTSGNFMVNLTNIAPYVGSSPAGCIGNVATTAGTNSAAFLHSHASNPYGPFFYFSAASPNNTSNYFLQCSDTTNAKAFIYSSGTFGSRTSTYGGISDIKVKQDIVDASSQWGDIKALRFRKYRFKDDPTGPLQLGLISQEAELVSPGLVFETPDTEMVEVPVLDENGEPVLKEDGTPQTTTERQETGEVTKSVKYSILYMKAVVALQEAMNRIEQLEADVAALKAR